NAKYGGHGDSADFDCYYEFAAMGTVADIMTLTDENRVLVDCGLKKMGNSKNFGINAILEGYFKNKSKKNISTDVIGFYISPRINAAGRLSQANRAVELFLSKNRRLASVIAEELSVLNRQRQETEREIFAQAENELSHVANRDKKKIIILCSDNWHQGVIGIVASKLSERHNKTFILFAKDAGGVYKGSCRSAKNINIADLLARCSDILIKYGGHEHAAGLSAQYENIAELDRRLNELADLANAEGEAENLLEIDCEIKACDVDCDMVREFELLEPFGTDNPVPSFALSNCKILHITPIGENRHIRLDFSQGDSFFEAVYFGMEAERFAFGKHEYVDVACNIEINEFASKQKVQYIVRDVRPEASHEKKYLAEKENYINFKDGGTGFIFNKSDLPDKEDFKSVYLFLSGNFKKEVSYDNVQSMNKLQLLYFDQSKRAISKFKFRIILDIFAEMGLICLEHDFDSVKKIKINHQDKKIDLNDSAIYSRLKSLNF
ncbi:MAG: DHH family phosphoesterase, partial [Oscillospiraceae bacterium]|nr:DHH family phosphoesterase [Oscillospiraceae bacterium]